MAVPSRGALGRVLRSLLTTELTRARGQRGVAYGASVAKHAWSDASRVTGHGPLDLGCDSLEALWLSSAACEMFDLISASRHQALIASDHFGEWVDIVLDAWRDGLDTVAFATSGTTGTPKRCTHRLANLCAEADHFAGLFCNRRRVLSFVPTHHIYGFLFTALLPDALRIECLDGASATEALGALRPGDLIVAFPERWRWIERVARRFGADVLGVTSTAPCPRDLIAALIGAGLAGMTEVYGSSETAGIATRQWPELAYRLLPRWRFAVEDEAALVDASGIPTAMPDVVRRIDMDTFVPIGRLDGAVQVGGFNVYPQQVAAALRERPGVAEVAVRLMRPDEGMRLKAFVVADGLIAEEALRASILAWLAENMNAASRPVDIAFGVQLPHNALGKLADW